MGTGRGLMNGENYQRGPGRSPGGGLLKSVKFVAQKMSFFSTETKIVTRAKLFQYNIIHYAYISHNM